MSLQHTNYHEVPKRITHPSCALNDTANMEVLRLNGRQIYLVVRQAGENVCALGDTKIGRTPASCPRPPVRVLSASPCPWTRRALKGSLCYQLPHHWSFLTDATVKQKNRDEKKSREKIWSRLFCILGTFPNNDDLKYPPINGQKKNSVALSIRTSYRVLRSRMSDISCAVTRSLVWINMKTFNFCSLVSVNFHCRSCYAISCKATLSANVYYYRHNSNQPNSFPFIATISIAHRHLWVWEDPWITWVIISSDDSSVHWTKVIIGLIFMNLFETNFNEMCKITAIFRS